MSEDKWMTLVEVCKYLKVSRETILNWINKKDMPAHKVGRLWRFDSVEVDAWIKTGAAAEDSKKH